MSPAPTCEGKPRPVIKIRLMALPEDAAAVVATLEQLFDVLDDSGDRRMRGGSKLRLRYLIVRHRP